MVEIQHPVIKDRENAFVPDYICFLNFVVSDYSSPIAPEPATYAVAEYKKNTEDAVAEIRRE